MSEEKNNDWIDCKKELPSETGWYKVKTPTGEYEAPYVHDGAGKLQWVAPEQSFITHWKKSEYVYKRTTGIYRLPNRQNRKSS